MFNIVDNSLGASILAKFVYPEAKYFKEIIDSLSKIIDEVALQLKPQGLEIKALDPARVALININIPNTVFLEYDVPEETVIGISTAFLSKVLKKVKKGDRFVLESAEDFVKVTIESIGKRFYKFRNLEVPLPEIPEASFEFNVNAQLIVDPFKQAIKDAETVGNILEIEAPDDQTLYLRGRGVTIAETKLAVGMPALISLEVKEPSKSSYQIDYLKYIIGLTKIAEVIVLKFSNKSPLELEFSFGESRLKYLMAPLVEE